MRFFSIVMVSVILILLAIAAGCTLSGPKSGALETPAGTAAGPADAGTTAPAPTTAVPVATAAGCPSGQAACADGTCRDLATDHDACGGCGNVCPAGYVCKASACVNPAGTQAGTAVPATVPADVTTQATPAQTANPVTSVTTTVPTTTPIYSTTYRYPGSLAGNLQLATVAETTYPPNVQYIDCSKYPISITSISPSAGPKAGGTPIVIHGSGFKRGAYLSVYVRFGPTHLSLPGGAISDTEIVLTSAGSSSTGTVDVQFGAAFNGVSNHCLSPVTSATKFTYT
jgi:hypothetical protein